MRGFGGQKRRYGLLAFFRLQRTGAIDQRPARLQQRDRPLQQPLLQRRQRGDIGLLPQPGDVGMAADGAGRGAGRVDQDAVEAAAVVPPCHSAASATTVSASSDSRARFSLQPRHPAGRAVDRGDAAPACDQLRGLAAGRGAEIGDALAGDVAEQARRQRGGGVLHPPLAVGEARQHRHRALQQRAHASRSAAFRRAGASPTASASDFTVMSSDGSWLIATAISRAVVSP